MWGFSDSYNQSLYQKQIYQEQTQFDVYLRYTIDTDMQNVFGVCVDYLALLQQQPNNAELLSVFKNRMILQYNLSNTIHNDLQQNSQTIGYRYFEQTKYSAQEKFLSVFESIKKGYQGPKQNEAFKILEEYFQNNLPNQVYVQQKNLEENGVRHQFNEKVVQQLITSMQSVDQQYEQLSRQKNYASVQSQDMITKANERFHQALQKIQNIKVEQRQLIPSNYPETVKRLLGSFYLLCQSQTNPNLEQDFVSNIFNLRQQKSSLAAHCLTDFCQYLESNTLQLEIQSWILYLNNEGGPNYYPASQQLTLRDAEQLKQFVKDCQTFIEDYGQKRNLVQIIQLLLKTALQIINQQGITQVNPLLALDLNTRDQIGTQFHNLQVQFKSQFMREFCRDVTNGTLKNHYSFQNEDQMSLYEDIALIQKLVG